MKEEEEEGEEGGGWAEVLRSERAGPCLEAEMVAQLETPKGAPSLLG